MKITIKKGESIQNAMLYLQSFFEGLETDYPILKGDMNVYVTLTGFGNRPYLGNDGEFILTEHGPEDIEAAKLSAAKQHLLVEWDRYRETMKPRILAAMRKVSLDREYLRTAEEKGKKPEMIERRKKQQEKHQEEFEEIGLHGILVETLNEALVNGDGIRWYLQKHSSQKTPYQYTITANLVFPSVNGETWTFCCYVGTRGSGRGSLCRGIPKGMKVSSVAD